MSGREEAERHLSRAIDRMRELDEPLSHEFQAIISGKTSPTISQLDSLRSIAERTIALLEQTTRS